MSSSLIASSRLGNRVAVGIERGLAELGRDQLLELLGDVVLEHLRLLVDPVPGHLQDLGQEELDQAVVADHLERHPLAPLGQPGPVVGLVLDQALVAESLQHPGGRGRRHSEPLGDGVGVRRAPRRAPEAGRSPSRSSQRPRRYAEPVACGHVGSARRRVPAVRHQTETRGWSRRGSRRRRRSRRCSAGGEPGPARSRTEGRSWPITWTIAPTPTPIRKAASSWL